MRSGVQHPDERTLRQMEIRYQPIHHFKAVTRINIDICPAGFGLHVSVLCRPRFQRPAGGGAHTDAAPAVCLCAVDEVRRFL